MEIIGVLRRKYWELLDDLELNEEELRKMVYSSIAVSKAKRKRGDKTYKWLILTGKARRDGKLKTELIKNFYKVTEETERKLRLLVKLYRAIKVLESG